MCIYNNPEGVISEEKLKENLSLMNFDMAEFEEVWSTIKESGINCFENAGFLINCVSREKLKYVAWI